MERQACVCETEVDRGGGEKKGTNGAVAIFSKGAIVSWLWGETEKVEGSPIPAH